MLPLTKQKLKFHQDAENCYICGKRVLKKLAKNKDYQKVRDHGHDTDKYRDASPSICNLKCNVPNESPVVFHNGLNYDYHFIIKELANKFEGEFECLGEDAEKHNFFPFQQKITKIDKNGSGSIVTISYKIKFIDSARFMASLLSNLVNNLAEGIHKTECKDCDSLLEYESVKDNLVKYKYLSCNKDYSYKLDEKLKKQFKNLMILINLF